MLPPGEPIRKIKRTTKEKLAIGLWVIAGVIASCALIFLYWFQRVYDPYVPDPNAKFYGYSLDATIPAEEIGFFNSWEFNDSAFVSHRYQYSPVYLIYFDIETHALLKFKVDLPCGEDLLGIRQTSSPNLVQVVHYDLNYSFQFSLFDFDSGEFLEQINHSDCLYGFEMDERPQLMLDGEWILYYKDEKEWRLINRLTGEDRFLAPLLQQSAESDVQFSVWNIAYNARSKLLAYDLYNHDSEGLQSLYVLDLETLQLTRIGEFPWFTGLSWSSDDNYLLGTSYRGDADFLLINLSEGCIAAKWKPENNVSLHEVSFSPSGENVLIGSLDGFFYLTAEEFYSVAELNPPCTMIDYQD